jgi:hypothetical protein
VSCSRSSSLGSELSILIGCSTDCALTRYAPRARRSFHQFISISPHRTVPRLPHPSSRIATMSGAGENRYVAPNESPAPRSLTCPLAGGGQDQDRATIARLRPPRAQAPPPRTADSSLPPHHLPMPGQLRASLLVQVSLRLRQPPSTTSLCAASTPTRSRTS